ncbi:3-hydroxyisobutyrate dehydrogenase [Alteromonas oceanisediminis]|uniref:3-hydroxyisobutyrate dehydrogenase n=1 Tax=Alteromonas oceanisediminis TaxID=2836180 RepID=UPI001BDA047D|nr:3-hydroxyisobutyrate dehydrogenase [Alteromonas oceanisediminis]MBT0587201.1 3-hydroxyisobutyrate dehydrogenase [Alteromonas oceanisediminis]
MNKVAFIGLGNMGGPMAANLVSAGFDVCVFDLMEDAVNQLVNQGARSAATAATAVEGADIVISMLPAGKHVRGLYIENTELLASLTEKALVVDCSTIDVESARAVAENLASQGKRFIDAPVSGGVAGAKAGTLTFIVGGDADDLARAQPALSAMGKNVFHAGAHGAGQIAKICNNILLSVLMAGTSEALQMAIDNGLDPKVMSDIMLQSSGRNWTLEVYNPCPGVLPDVPSSNEYKGGFMVDLMNKDLMLAMQCAAQSQSSVPMGNQAQALYKQHSENGSGQLDFSSIFNLFASK